MRIYTPGQIAVLLKMGLDPNISYYYEPTWVSKKKVKNELSSLINKIRSCTNRASKKPYKKFGAAYFFLGCTYDVFKEHIEKQFTKGMNWENHGKWHMDHIVPISIAQNEEELILLAKYTNLRPLWQSENNKKKDKRTFLI